MPVYIDIPPEYEQQLQELADRDDRSYRQEAASLLKWAITQRIKAPGASLTRIEERNVYVQE
jgi:hypothetical protein